MFFENDPIDVMVNLLGGLLNDAEDVEVIEEVPELFDLLLTPFGETLFSAGNLNVLLIEGRLLESKVFLQDLFKGFHGTKDLIEIILKDFFEFRIDSVLFFVLGGQGVFPDIRIIGRIANGIKTGGERIEGLAGSEGVPRDKRSVLDFTGRDKFFDSAEKDIGIMVFGPDIFDADEDYVNHKIAY